MTKMRQWSLVTFIVVIAVLAGGWLLLVKPERSHIASVKSQAATQQQANQVLLQEITARQGQQKLLPHEQAQLQKLATQIPTAPNEPDIIRNMSAAASGANVDLLSITPATATAITAAAPATATPGAATLPAATTGNLLELPVALTVVGSYANLESYFQLLEKLPRALLVTSFTLCPMKSTDGGSACAPPTLPAGTVIADGAVGASISANVFFTPTAAVTTPAVATLPGTTTPTSPATTPASPAATTTTTAPTAPASGN
jgi:Tfp pilus assembly protein PilO